MLIDGTSKKMSIEENINSKEEREKNRKGNRFKENNIQTKKKSKKEEKTQDNNEYNYLNRKKHKKLKIFGIVIAIILIIVIVLVALVYGFLNSKLGKLQIEQITNDLNELGISEANQDSEMSKYRNIAILGLDSRYDTYDSDYRTDCIMVASINKETNEVQLYSIYRDNYVQMELDGEVIFDKINHAYYNGVENTLKTINENLDLNLTEYIMADFTAIADLVDSVGGIDIDILSFIAFICFTILPFISIICTDTSLFTSDTIIHPLPPITFTLLFTI